jgi:hypothetical protein
MYARRGQLEAKNGIMKLLKEETYKTCNEKFEEIKFNSML